MRFLTLLLIAPLTACATITTDSTQVIALETNPAGASCLLHNAVGSWELNNTPGEVAVKRNFSPLEITCGKEGREARVTLEPHTRGRAYGNILLGGAPAIIDANTGAAYEYRPTTMPLELK